MNMPYLPSLQKQPKFDPLFYLLILATILILIGIARAEIIKPKEGLNKVNIAHQNLEPHSGSYCPSYWLSRINANGGLPLVASWYSIESLKKEGTWKISKGRMANGEFFNENNYTAAVYGYAFGTKLKVTNLENGLSVEVTVTDRISKRFKDKRIDLSKRAFAQIADIKQGIIQVKIEKI